MVNCVLRELASVNDMFDLYSLAEKRSNSKKYRLIVENLFENIYPLLPFYLKSEVFEVIDRLSVTTYEQSKCENKTLVFFPYKAMSNERNIDVMLDDSICINFDSCDIGNIKVLRKLINPLSKDCCYAFGRNENDDNYYAIGSTRIENLDNDLYYKCIIVGQMQWKLSLHCPTGQDIKLFGYVNSKFVEYDKADSFHNQKTEDLNEKIKSANIGKEYHDAISRIYQLVNDYIEKNSKCGTSFVIFSSCYKESGENYVAKEAERLASGLPARGYMLKKFTNLSEEVLNQIINIDGGIIVDSNCVCYAYGCIFDGTVKNGFEGERGSGARHNSMKLYISNKQKNVCVGMVFSEDGGVSLYS